MSKEKKGFKRKVLAGIVSVCVLLSNVNITAFAAEPRNVSLGSYITESDPSTMDDWKNFFANGVNGDKAISTEFAGGVWTDKSVFTQSEAKEVSEFVNVDVENIGADNFLIALSVLASNKEIKGYSTIPTDTVLVLDLSQSMDTSQSIPDMVNAANRAITKLHDLNKNNRVGVILYSGNTSFGSSNTDTGIELLPLGRYTANGNGQFLTYSSYRFNQSDRNGTQVSIATGVQTETKENVTINSKITQGGTYIQNGLYKAYQMFEAVDDTTVSTEEGNNVQEGVKRMPIMVLMSDGAPTAGTTSYNNVGTSNAGNGGRSTAGLGFLTQLTASWAREKIESKYDNEMKFYSLGLDLTRDSDTTAQSVAASVLDPANSMSSIDSAWTSFITNGSVSVSVPNSTGNNSDNGNKTVTVSKDATIFNDSQKDYQTYIDRYFEADSNAELNAAFEDIVDEIILQSAYYPTLVSSGEHNLDGYVTFEDELGQFMEVKNMTGLLIGDTLYSGEALAKMMGEGAFGNRYEWTELGWELVYTVAERIGVDQQTAISLLMSAWADGQLSYDETTDAYSNYIGWYEGENGQYIAYWNEEHTDEEVAAEVENGAKYITKSYGFYGPTDEESSIAGRNMMHVVIKVRTEIATKHQDVVYQIPASLIPTVTYEITLNSNSLETATEIAIDRNAQEPLRLLFEVGLRSDINELNIDEVMSNLGEGQHVHKNTDGTYYFYSNQWGDGHDADFNYTDPTTHLTTESYFEPSVENERYYYVTDTVICVDQEGTKYEGSTAPSGTGYYHGRTYFVATGNGSQAEVATTYVPISSATLAETANVEKQGDYWYVKAGTVFQETARFQTEKTENTTETLRYSDYPLVSHPENASDKYEAYAFLGNNGRLTVTPATGIKLTKQVDETLADVDQEYTFKIQINTTEEIYTAKLTRGAGEAEYIQFEGGFAEVSVKAGETIYITELPTGEYIVNEVINGDYKVASVSINGSEENRITAKGTIVSTDLEDIVFTNTENKVGNLVVRKTVTHDLPSDPTALADIEFKIQVELKDAAGELLKNQEYLDGSNNSIKTNEEGIAELTLTHGEAITITGLPEGATYTVTEPEDTMPDGFDLQPNASLAGTITANGSVVANVVNDYNPTSVPGEPIAINVTKSITGDEWDDSYVFTFHLDKMLEDGTWEKIGESQTANSQNQTFSFAIPANSLTTVGRHYFRVIEENPNSIPGIISDATRYFYIDVTDNDMDGKLEIAAIVGNDVEENLVNNEIKMNFENTYTTSGEATVNIPIEKFLNNNTGVDIGLDGFQFALYRGDNQIDGTLVSTNEVGEATIKLTYDSATFGTLDQSDGTADNKHVLVYTLKEIDQGEDGMSYSKEEYTVTITLTSVGGALTASTVISKDGQTVSEAEFTNTFTLQTHDSLVISATKELDGRTLDDGEFKFNLYKTGADFYVADNADAVEEAFNGADGTVVFDDFSYNQVGSYYYVIREDATNPKGGVTYSKEAYYVTVKVSNDGNVPFIESVTYVKPGSGTINADQVVFTNTYEAEPTSAIIEGTKSLSGKTLEHGMFEFELYDYTENTQGERIDTAENTLDGKFTFDEIKYTAAGTYEYLVVEKDLKELGYTYDDAQYKVTIEVTDNGLGNLVAEEPVIQEIGGYRTTLAFENSYKPLALTNLSMSIEKTLRNRMIEADEFSFEVYEVDSMFTIDEEQDPLQTVQNDGEGKVVFRNQSDTDKTFYFEEIGTHYFVIKEVIPDNPEPHIVYDNREYQVTVLVYDQGGRLSAHVTYALNGQEVTDPTFENVYIPSPEKEVYKKGDVETSIDGKIVEAGEVLTYQISYMNASESAVDVTITDTIPAGTTYVAHSATEVGVVEYKDGQLIWTIEDVKPGSTVTVSFDVEVNGEKVNIYNTGYIQVGEHVYKTNEVYNSLFDKEVDKTAARINEELTYTINYQNTEDTKATITIEDKLVEGLTYVEGSASDNGVYDSKTHTITWTLTGVEAGAIGKVSFKAIVNEKAVEVIDNVATVQVGDSQTIKVKTDTATTEVLTPDLEIVKKQALGNGTATTENIKAKAGEKITYSITITNKGKAAATGIVLTDKIPTGLTLVDGTISNEGILKDGAITWNIDSLEAGASVTVEFTVVVPEAEKDTNYVNVATAVYENNPENPTDPDEPKKPEESNKVTIEYVETVIPEESPKTGDNASTAMWSTLAFGSLMVCGVILVSEKKRKNEF